MSRNGITICHSAVIAGFAAAMLAATPAAAIDNNRAKLKSMSFTAESVDRLHGGEAVIRVISTDGRTWNRLRGGLVWFNARMKVDTKWPGYVVGVSLRLGSCRGEQCDSAPVLWRRTIEERDYSGRIETSFDASDLPAAANASNSTSAILRRCNDKLRPDGPSRSHSFRHALYATLTADTAETLNLRFVQSQPNGIGDGWWTTLDHTKSSAITVKVICEAMITAPVGDLQHDFGDFEVESVKLFLTTYQSNQPGSNPGTVCPALKVTSRAQTNQAGPVTMRIWRQKGDGPITSNLHQATASFDAARNGYFATVEDFETVGTTSYYQFKTEIVGDASDPFSPSDGWKGITVHCTSPGGGGLTTVPQDNPGLPTPGAKWQGEVTIADSAGRRKTCPRSAQVSFTAARAAPGDFAYRIQCSNGAYFTGTATGYAQGNLFQVTGAHALSINRTRAVRCTLQELQPAPVTVDTGEADFTCNNPTVDPGVGDLVVDIAPETPPPVVDPDRPCPPGQRRERGKCVDKPLSVICGANEKRVGRKCVGVTIHCLRGFHQVGLKCVPDPGAVADPPKLACIGGKIATIGKKPARQECRCPGGLNRKSIGPNRYRCETGATAAVTCLNGTVRGGRCVCAPSAKKVQIGPSAWRCQRPKATPGSGTRSMGSVKTGAPARFHPGVISRFPQGDRPVLKRRKPKTVQ